MKQLWGLGDIREVGDHKIYCPKCGNYLEVVSNGLLGGELFYCPKEKKVFYIQITEFTKPGKEYLDHCEAEINLDSVRERVCYKNYKRVLEVIENEKF